MPKRKLANWLTDFCSFASYGEAPPSMYFWVGACAIAGALRRQVWIDQKYFKWIPNLYVIIVAPPGIVSKSTTSSIGMSLLREVPGIHFGPDVVTWQALAKSMGESLESFEIDGVFYPMCAITIESSEFGTFLNPHDREMVDLLVSLWDGKDGVFKKVTKTSGNDDIANPFINFIACTTPAWIEGNFPEYMIGGGFTSRCVFVYAEEKFKYVAYPHLAVPRDFAQQRATLIHDLEIIAQLRGEFKLTPGAVAWGTRWYEAHYQNRPAHLDNDRFGGYIARKQTHIHKLSMILSAAERSDLTITEAELEQANVIVSSLEENMSRVFDRIGKTDDTKRASDLVQFCKLVGPAGLTHRELYAKCYRTMSYNDFELALKGSIVAGYVKQEQVGDQLGVRYTGG